MKLKFKMETVRFGGHNLNFNTIILFYLLFQIWLRLKNCKLQWPLHSTLPSNRSRRRRRQPIEWKVIGSTRLRLLGVGPTLQLANRKFVKFVSGEPKLFLLWRLSSHNSAFANVPPLLLPQETQLVINDPSSSSLTIFDSLIFIYFDPFRFQIRSPILAVGNGTPVIEAWNPGFENSEQATR